MQEEDNTEVTRAVVGWHVTAYQDLGLLPWLDACRCCLQNLLWPKTALNDLSVTLRIPNHCLLTPLLSPKDRKV